MEFTPEVNQGLYDSLARKISQRGQNAIGQGHEESLARGLQGDPFEASLTGAARANTSNELADLDANLAYNVAGMNREERLGQQAHGWNVEEAQKGRDFSAAEAEKQRSFNNMMAWQNYAEQNDMANTQARREGQAAYWQVPIQAGAAAAGAWAGSRKK